MNFNRPKVTRRRRRKGATTHLYDFITLFSFCKVRLHSFFALFLRFLPPFPPPGNDVGGRTQNRDGRRTRRGQTFVFFGFRGQTRSSPVPSLQTRPAGDRILPRTPVVRSLFVGATTRRPHVLPARLPRQTTCKRGRRTRRLPRNKVSSGFSLAPAQNSVQVPRLLWRGARSRLFGKLHLPERPAFHAPRVTPPRGR